MYLDMKMVASDQLTDTTRGAFRLSCARCGEQPVTGSRLCIEHVWEAMLEGIDASPAPVERGQAVEEVRSAA